VRRDRPERVKPPARLDSNGAIGVGRAALDVEIESGFLTAVGGRRDGGFWSDGAIWQGKGTLAVGR